MKFTSNLPIALLGEISSLLILRQVLIICKYTCSTLCVLECYVQAILNLNIVDSLCTEMLISFCEVFKNKGSYTGYTQKNGAVSKVNKEFISHLTRAQRTPSAAAIVQVSHALPAVCFSCLMRGQFPRWRRSRKSLSVCSVLRCPDL